MRRYYPTFTQQQTERLIALNRHLVELEYWCLQRARNIVQEYVRLTGVAVNGREGQDFELESIVEYYRPLTTEEEQDVEVSHDGLILRTVFIAMSPLKWYFLNPTPEGAASIFESLYYNWHDGIEQIAGLKDQRVCWSFHDLHDHHGLTWDQILHIETVWIDVKAIHQLVTSVGKPFGAAIELR